MHRHHLLLMALCLTACSSPAAVPVVAAAQPQAVPVRSSSDILGRWDVVSFEGYEPARMQGATSAAFADFRPDGVSLRIECNYSGVSGIVSAGRFAVRPGPRMQTEMGCGPEREQRDSRYFAFFDRSPAVDLLPDGRLRLVAGDSVLILERPEIRRLANVPAPAELNGSWRMDSLTRYEPGGGHSGIGLSDVAGRIVISGNRLSYDRCPQYAVDFTFSSDGRLVKSSSDALPANLDCPSLEYPDYDAPALPSAMLILPLLHSNPWVEDVGNGRLLIANEQLGLLLAREPN